MARPRVSTPPADAIRALIRDDGLLCVRATPNARQDSLAVGEIDGRAVLLAHVRAVPEDGRANDAVRALIARALGVAASQLELERGASARMKFFRLVQG